MLLGVANVLYQTTAMQNIEKLHSPADSQNRLVLLKHSLVNPPHSLETQLAF